MTLLCPVSHKVKPKTNMDSCLSQRNFDSCHILVTTLQKRNGKLGRIIRYLIDTVSQRSHISENAAKNLCPDENKLFDIHCEVYTYIGQEAKGFKQMPSGIQLEDRFIFVPLLANITLGKNLKYQV